MMTRTFDAEGNTANTQRKTQTINIRYNKLVPPLQANQPYATVTGSDKIAHHERHKSVEHTTSSVHFDLYRNQEKEFVPL